MFNHKNGRSFLNEFIVSNKMRVKATIFIFRYKFILIKITFTAIESS